MYLILILILIFLILKQKSRYINCRKSTIDNPYMNLLLENDGLKACENEEYKINYNFNLPEELYNRKNLSIYTKAITNIPNLNELGNNLYKINKTCKSDNVKCLQYDNLKYY